MRYTVDGSTPTTDSPLVIGPILGHDVVALNALAGAGRWRASTVPARIHPHRLS
jgi:hypothetical protein